MNPETAIFKFNGKGSTKPKNGQFVIWIWYQAGQVVAGDYYKRKARDASKYYAEINDPIPSHWMPWPNDQAQRPPTQTP